MTVRVLLITGSLGPGGTELAVATLARELAARGRVAPRIVTLGDGGEHAERLRAAGVPVEELGISGGARSLGGLRRLRLIPQMIRHERIRIVHTFLFDADFYGMLAARRGAPWAIVTTRRAIKRGRLLHLLGYRLTNPLVDRIVCNSEAVSRFTLHAEGASRRKVLVIPNGVDAARFERGDGATMRRRLGLRTEDLVVGAVGTIKKVKGQAVLLEAMRPLFERHAALRLVLAGEVTRGYGEELRRQAAALGWEDRVLFPGVIEEVPDLLAALDLFVLPSLSEGMSNALLEAMAAGRPIVATEAGGNGECLDGGNAGLLVPPGDAEALGRALERLLEAPDRRRDLARRARGRVQDEYSLGKMLDRTETLYAELLGRDWKPLIRRPTALTGDRPAAAGRGPR
ncbi:MAG: glycosyltransferase [Acidobacteria bacterium]|jgi:glycosyltransferase involved in cell wall biosynthesis|nr:glycosyltransferase [Acidobacteriota bacterium]